MEPTDAANAFHADDSFCQAPVSTPEHVTENVIHSSYANDMKGVSRPDSSGSSEISTFQSEQMSFVQEEEMRSYSGARYQSDFVTRERSNERCGHHLNLSESSCTSDVNLLPCAVSPLVATSEQISQWYPDRSESFSYLQAPSRPTSIPPSELTYHLGNHGNGGQVFRNNASSGYRLDYYAYNQPTMSSGCYRGIENRSYAPYDYTKF